MASGSGSVDEMTKWWASLLLLPLFGRVDAHEGHHHGPHTQEAKRVDANEAHRLAFEEIQAEYRKSVEPVFQNKCAPCHSSDFEAPWYSKIPGIHQLVEHDRSEAKEHLEISKGFPFGGHGEPGEDLEAIGDAVRKGSMPTRLYVWMHPSSVLTPVEKETILAWVNASEDKLSALTPGEKHP